MATIYLTINSKFNNNEKTPSYPSLQFDFYPAFLP